MDERRCFGCMKIMKGNGICPHCGYDNRIPNEDYQLPAGTVLQEQYLVGRVLGQGGFGITYMGWDRYLEIPVAIKEYFPVGVVNRNSSASTEVLSGSGEIGARFRNNKERFVREVKSLAKLSGIPEIVQVKTFFLANNTAYIVMEYIEGITLKEYVKLHGGKLDADEAVGLLGPVMKALAKVHKAGLVHRDISPENIMIQKNGTVKLLDFGAVRDVGLADPEKPLTKSTEAILKQGYAPVEQYQSRGALGPWTDVYAMCATLYFCLTGEAPADSPGRILGEEIEWFEEKGISVPGYVEETLKDGMVLRAGDRIQDMNVLYQRLKPSAVREPAPSVPENRQESLKDPGRQLWSSFRDTNGRKWLLPAAAAVLLIIAAFGAWRLLKHPAPTPEPEEMLSETEETGAEADLITGQCGDHAFYTLDPETGELVFSAEGEEQATWDFCSPEQDGEFDWQHVLPWWESRELVVRAVIPENITSLGQYAFAYCPNLKQADGLEHLIYINDGAFMNTQLESVSFSDQLYRIGFDAFNGCRNLREIELPESLETLDQDAFSNTGLTKAVIHGNPDFQASKGTPSWRDGDTVFGEADLCSQPLGGPIIIAESGSTAEEFAKQNQLPFVTLGQTPESAVSGQCGDNVFWELDLESGVLTLSGEGEPWMYWGTLPEAETEERLWPEWNSYRNFIRKAVVEAGVTKLSGGLFMECVNLEEIDLGTIEEIDTNAVCATRLTSVEFPETLRKIENYGFQANEYLESVVLPERVELLCLPFANCPSLKEITILGSPVFIDANEWGNAGNTSMVRDENEESDPGASALDPQVTIRAYEGSTAEAYAKRYGNPFVSLGEIKAPETMEGQCGDDVYWKLDPESGLLTLSGTGEIWEYSTVGYDDGRISLTDEDSLPDWFRYRGLIRKVTVGPEIVSLGGNLFYDCGNLEEIDLGNILSLNFNSLYGTSIASLALPDTLESIGSGALAENPSLESVVFPESVQDIETPLYGCRNLREVTFLGSPALLGPGGSTEYASMFALDDDMADRAEPEMVIRGHEGTTAQTYAEKHDCQFAALNGEE